VDSAATWHSGGILDTLTYWLYASLFGCPAPSRHDTLQEPAAVVMDGRLGRPSSQGRLLTVVGSLCGDLVPPCMSVFAPGWSTRSLPCVGGDAVGSIPTPLSCIWTRTLTGSCGQPALSEGADHKSAVDTLCYPSLRNLGSSTVDLEIVSLCCLDSELRLFPPTLSLQGVGG
jgi:hypothetical protein